MSEKIHSGTYYYLTDEDRDQITKYFNERDLEELIGVLFRPCSSGFVSYLA
jgi:hypothetical protein